MKFRHPLITTDTKKIYEESDDKKLPQKILEELPGIDPEMELRLWMTRRKMLGGNMGLEKVVQIGRKRTEPTELCFRRTERSITGRLQTMKRTRRKR